MLPTVGAQGTVCPTALRQMAETSKHICYFGTFLSWYIKKFKMINDKWSNSKFQDLGRIADQALIKRHSHPPVRYPHQKHLDQTAECISLYNSTDILLGFHHLPLTRDGLWAVLILDIMHVSKVGVEVLLSVCVYYSMQRWWEDCALHRERQPIALTGEPCGPLWTAWRKTQWPLSRRMSCWRTQLTVWDRPSTKTPTLSPQRRRHLQPVRFLHTPRL